MPTQKTSTKRKRERKNIHMCIFFNRKLSHVRSRDLTASGHILAADVVDIVLFIN